MSGCLDGIRVLELARYQAGPRGGMILFDLGAEVIKIEKPGGEETRQSPPLVNGQSVYFSVYNRGKKSVCLDMRREEGKAVFFDLLNTADFVLEKRDAAKRWANHVSADEKVGATWRYLLISETDVRTARGSWEVLRCLGGP